MFEFGITPGVYIPMAFMFFVIVGGVFFFELKLCNENDPRRFKMTALKVCRQYLKYLIGLTAFIIISWLILSIVGMPRAFSDIDWSVIDSLFLLFVAASAWMIPRFGDAADEVTMKWAKKKSRK